ncbi:MAG: 50S ribosomal protein L10 [Oscillospiraceae bacterium]|nr:50S ribosomal protein L10 [Oscillospiraceae bacterium]
MPNEKILSEKQAIVAALTEKLQNAAGGVLVDYKGITVAEDTALRTEMRKNGVDYAVVKNTLTRFAVKEAGLEELSSVLEGTTSLAVSADDPTAPARVVAEFAKKMNGEKFTIKAGFVDGKAIGVEEVKALAALPSKEVLLSMLLSAMQGPVRGLAVSLDATISGLARALQAVADQKAG